MWDHSQIQKKMWDHFFFERDFFAWPTFVRKFSYHIFTCLLDPGLTSTTRLSYYLVLTSTYLRLARFRSSSSPECQVARIALIRDYLAIIFFCAAGASETSIHERAVQARPSYAYSIGTHLLVLGTRPPVPGTRLPVPGTRLFCRRGSLCGKLNLVWTAVYF